MTLLTLTLALALTNPVTAKSAGCRDSNEQGFRLIATYLEEHSTASWSLRVNARGRAVLQSGGERRFVVPKRSLDALRSLVSQQDLWSMASDIGEPTQLWSLSLMVCEGNRSKEVTLNQPKSADSLTAEERRFVMVWVAVRRLFVSEKARDVDHLEALLRK